MMRMLWNILAVAGLLALASCGGDRGPDAKPGDQASANQPTNRIDLPGSVRQNLGITWAEAHRGRLAEVLSVPGEIVARPDRNWDLRAPLPGALTAIAGPWEQVEAGQVVAKIASPMLAEMQAELHLERVRAEQARIDLARARAEVKPTEALVAARMRAVTEARESLPGYEKGRDQARKVAAEAAERLEEVLLLRKSGAASSAALLAARRDALEVTVVANEAERALRQARVETAQEALEAETIRAALAESDRKIRLLETTLSTAEAAFAQRLESLAALGGFEVEDLLDEGSGRPAWTELRELPLRAPVRGVVIKVSARAGTWVDRDAELLGILDPSSLMFRALLPESDAGRLPVDLAMSVELPGLEASFPAGSAAVRPVADPKTRSVFLEALVDNPEGRLRPGSSATAKVLLRRSAAEEVIVSVHCVVRDGLESVVFRRDPANPDQVIRTVVTLGMESGGQVEIIAGVGAGDQLVDDGAHQLRQTGLGKAAAGGHFHADGTWHAGDE